MTRLSRAAQLIGAFGIILAGSAGLSHATYTKIGYNTTVGPFNGSGYTSQQTKTDAYEDGAINSEGVGGNYRVDARLENANGAAAGSVWRRLDDNINKQLPNLINRGWSTRVHFSNDLSTRVHVQVWGRWMAR